MKQLVFLIFVIINLAAHAQKKTVEAARVAFISQKISLTPAQAEKFWPVYNEFNDSKTAIRKSIRMLYTNMTLASEQVPEKIKQNIQQLLVLKQQDVNVEKEYYARYLLIISPQQLSDLLLAEREFHKLLLKKVAEE